MYRHNAVARQPRPVGWLARSGYLGAFLEMFTEIPQRLGCPRGDNPVGNVGV